ncbi:hypothetical protein [Marinobacterium jannaschii]|uniref:hypothetical protein n=1 Tax=Marinobacterium jannaschii TaxID=64970 RepID=UPI000482DE6A|nr:hypothetical protein [Marinobacterium jannaschii]
MMIADLIDQDDFRDRLIALGIELGQDDSPEQCAEKAAAWFATADSDSQQALIALVNELVADKGVVLPDVYEAIKLHLSSLS